MSTKTIHIFNSDSAKQNVNYGTIDVPQPKNFTRNGAYISQWKYENFNDLDKESDNKKFLLDPNSEDGGYTKNNYAAQLLSCVEIDWGNATMDKDWEDWTTEAGYDFPEKIKTSADLLQFIYMLRWQIAHIDVVPASYTLSLSSTSLTVNYKATQTITANASQNGTSATPSTYSWSFSETGKFRISQGGDTKTPTVEHLETLISTWTLPTPTGSVTQEMQSSTDTAKVTCTPGNVTTEKAPSASQSTLTCEVTWSDGHKETKNATVKSSGYDHGTKPTVSSYSWAIVSGSEYATLSNSTSATCTLTGRNTATSSKTVKVVCQVTWTSGAKDTSEIPVTVPAVVPPQTTYYWYVGQTDPSTMNSISPIVTDNTSPGWRLIGTTLPTYSASNKLWSASNAITTGESFAKQYVVIPVNSSACPRDGAGNDVTTVDMYTRLSNVTISGVTYKVYESIPKRKKYDLDTY